MSDKICEVKESRVKALAEKCPDYREAMETLFPGVLKKDGGFKVGDIVEHDENGIGIIKGFSKADEERVAVEFFVWDHGHDLGDSYNFSANPGHGWFCLKNELTLVYRPA